MKKITIMMLFAAIVCSCGPKSAPKLLSPLPSGLEIDALTDCTVPAKFTSDNFRWMGGNLTMQVFSEDLYDPVRGREERKVLSEAIDCMNHKFGLKTVRLAVEDGESDHWKSKSEHRSPNYLTDIDEILTVQI